MRPLSPKAHYVSFGYNLPTVVGLLSRTAGGGRLNVDARRRRGCRILLHGLRSGHGRRVISGMAAEDKAAEPNARVQ